MLSSLTRNALQVARCRFQTVLHSPARQLCISAQEAAAMVSPMQMSATTIVASPLDDVLVAVAACVERRRHS